MERRAAGPFPHQELAEGLDEITDVSSRLRLRRSRCRPVTRRRGGEAGWRGLHLGRAVRRTSADDAPDFTRQGNPDCRRAGARDGASGRLRPNRATDKSRWARRSASARGIAETLASGFRSARAHYPLANRSDVSHGANLDATGVRPRKFRRDPDRFLHVFGFDQVETAEDLFCFGKRSIENGLSAFPYAH